MGNFKIRKPPDQEGLITFLYKNTKKPETWFLKNLKVSHLVFTLAVKAVSNDLFMHCILKFVALSCKL